MIKDRISVLVSKVGSQNKASKKIGVSQSGLNHLVSGKREPNIGTLLAISTAFPQLNLHWLITGEGDMWLSTSNTAVIHSC